MVQVWECLSIQVTPDTPIAAFDVDPVGRRFDIEGDRPIVEAVQKVAEARGIPMAHVALAWVLKHPVVAAPIVGPHQTTPSPRRRHCTRRPTQRRRNPHARGTLRSTSADWFLMTSTT
jgi:hypothetical protein